MSKRRRSRGSGSVYRQRPGGPWWIAYSGADGKRVQEPTGLKNKGDAERMLLRRTGAREHGLPVIARVEQYTFEEAAKAKVDDSTNKGRKAVDELERRIRLHLQPFFGGRRLVTIHPDDIRRFVAKRKADTIVVAKARTITLADGTVEHRDEQRKPVSNGEINRELQALKSIFSLAVKDGKLPMRPNIEMLREDNVRTGFFEAEQMASVLRHLPEELRPVVQFAYSTGWRLASEVLSLQWRQVDFDGGEVRLDAGSTKNGDGRVFYMTDALRALLKVQNTGNEQLKAKGIICPWVFWRMVAEERGGEKKPHRIISINKAWKAACLAAGCPGRIPHDLRRTAVRNLVRAGVPERVAMRLTGHKTASVFNRYNIVSDGDLRDAAKRLDFATTSR